MNKYHTTSEPLRRKHTPQHSNALLSLHMRTNVMTAYAGANSDVEIKSTR